MYWCTKWKMAGKILNSKKLKSITNIRATHVDDDFNLIIFNDRSERTLVSLTILLDLITQVAQ